MVALSVENPDKSPRLRSPPPAGSTSYREPDLRSSTRLPSGAQATAAPQASPGDIVDWLVPSPLETRTPRLVVAMTRV